MEEQENQTKEKNKEDKVISLPSKEDILRILKEENPPVDNKQKYVKLIFILEIKKINETLGILKGEYYESDKLEYRGSLLLPIPKGNSNQNSVWDSLKAGDYQFYGFTLDSREPKIPEKVMNFFRRSFDDSRIQDFIPFAGGRGKSE